MPADVHGARACTRQGSRARAILELADACALRGGRGLTVGELRDAWREEHGEPPKSFVAEVASMVRRGVLVATGGRASKTEYAPPGVVTPSGASPSLNEADDAQRVLLGLRSIHERVQRPVSTAEVRQELERVGIRLQSSDVNAVKKRLTTLSERRRRGFADSRAPLVRRLDDVAIGGIQRTMWLPLEDGQHPADWAPEPQTMFVPRSRAEAVRAAVEEATSVFNRPVSKAELRLWLRSPDGRKYGASLADGLSRALAAFGANEHAAAAQDGRLRTIDTAYTAHGGAPVRYSTTAPSRTATLTLRLEDALYAWGVPEELALFARTGSPIASVAMRDVAPIASDRREVLTERLQALVPQEDREAVLEGLRTVERALLAIAEKVEGRFARPAQDRAKAATARRAAAEELFARTLQPSAPFTAQALRGVLIAGEAAVATPNDLEPLIVAAMRATGEDRPHVLSLLEHVRRFGEPDGEERGQQPFAPPAPRIDRVDAIATLLHRVGGPATRALLAAARRSIGYCVRDARAVAAWSSRPSTAIGPLRRSLAVVRGLLGDDLPFDAVVPDAASGKDAAAWALATIVASPSDAAQRLLAAEGQAHADARSVLQRARMRVRLGHLLTAIE